MVCASSSFDSVIGDKLVLGQFRISLIFSSVAWISEFHCSVL